MENRRKFLSDFLGKEIYVISKEVSAYRQSEKPVETPKVEENTIEYSGSNSKGILVIIEENISELEMDLLDNILKSVEVSRDDIALIQSDSSLGNSIDKLEDIPSRILLSFGITSGKSRFLDIQTKYAPTTVKGRKVIIVDSLKLINEEKDLKIRLWKCLKKVFRNQD